MLLDSNDFLPSCRHACIKANIYRCLNNLIGASYLSKIISLHEQYACYIHNPLKDHTQILLNVQPQKSKMTRYPRFTSWAGPQKKPMTKVVDAILRTYLGELDMSETGCGGESYSQDRIPDLLEREVRIEKRSDGKYSVSVFDPIRDDSLACYLKRNYELWDFKVFDSRKEAESYASLQKKSW